MSSPLNSPKQSTFASLSLAASALEALHAVSAQVSASLQWSPLDGGSARRTVALFTGEAHEQKFAAAQALARDLQLPLYRVDLHRLTSKYLDETEKNLAQLFPSTGSGGANLIFDEGNSLFGKRTEVSDSHGRYAEDPIRLVPRMEDYLGLLVIATESSDDLDPELRKGVHFCINFPI